MAPSVLHVGLVALGNGPNGVKKLTMHVLARRLCYAQINTSACSRDRIGVTGPDSQPYIDTQNTTMTANHRDLYSLYPLDDGEIRVIIIEPSIIGDAPIIGSLAVVHIADPSADFAALSYTWGRPFNGFDRPGEVILLCGHRVAVTGNLYEALQRLRMPHQPLRIWIDALCINQTDNVEKAQQVSQMAQIYANASKTLVWLGRESQFGDGEVTLAWVETVEEHGQGCIDDLLILSKARRSIIDPADRQKLDARAESFLSRLFLEGRIGSLLGTKYADTVDISRPLRQHPDGHSHTMASSDPVAFVCIRIRAFYKRSYWSRRWIIQELFHSRFAIVICGLHKIEWPRLQRAHAHLMKFAEAASEILRWSTLGYPEPPALVPMVSFRKQDTSTTRLVSRMTSYAEAKCQDDRDTAFALLSLDQSPCLQADYTVSAAVIWTRLAMACVTDGLTAYVLKEAAAQLPRSPAQPGQPSWVPDFSFANYEPTVDKLDIPGHIEDQSTLSCELYQFGEVSHDVTRAKLFQNLQADRLGNESADPIEAASKHLHAKCTFWPGDILCNLTRDIPVGAIFRWSFLTLRRTTPPETKKGDLDVRYTLVGLYLIGVANLPNLAPVRRRYKID